ncbi:hypothetical protein AVEN_144754-1 [Araneus ventricosus]|uniref:Uncharacterized protein n=1 Tax=Araneus ventricosus TaxID=182803 RepID=A0A4Y2J4N2_ARAVE|nr:hypothetical protein AVEN_144754-1 [Araneus ventricosus]
MRQSLPADFSRAYQNVLYCRQDYNPQQSQQQWNSSDQRWMSGGSIKREPCPQHGVVPDSPEWAEVLPHPRKNGGSTQSDKQLRWVKFGKLKNKLKLLLGTIYQPAADWSCGAGSEGIMDPRPCGFKTINPFHMILFNFLTR